VQALGWRTAFVGLGVGILVVALPVVLLFLKDEPAGGAERRASASVLDAKPLPIIELGRHANFWWLALSFFVCGVTTAGLIDTHLIPYAQDIHIDPITAATAFGVLGTFNVLGTIVSGAVSDRFGHKWVLGWVYAGRAVTLVFLPMVREPVMLFVFAVAFGLVDFATVPPTTTLSTTLFGRRAGGTVVGLVSLSHQIGSAMGSYAGGFIHDAAGSYLPFFLAGAAWCIAAAAMSWAIADTPAAEAAPAPA